MAGGHTKIDPGTDKQHAEIPLVQRKLQITPAYCHRVKTENDIKRSDATPVSLLSSAMNALPAFSSVLLAIIVLVLCSAAIAQEEPTQGDENGMYSLQDLRDAVELTEDKRVFATTLMENLFGDDEDTALRLISRNIIKDPVDVEVNEEEITAELACLEKVEGDLSIFGMELPAVLKEISAKVKKALKSCEETVSETEQIVTSELDEIVESSFEKKPGSKGLDIDRVSSKYHYDRGLEYVKSQDYLKAEASFSKSIASRENVAALRMRSAMLLKRGEMDAAMADLSKCVELDPGRELHYLTRAVTRQLVGDHKGAIDDYSRAIKIQPDAPRSWGNRGLAWMKVGRNDKAITDLDQSLEIWSEYPEGLYNRGVIRQKLKDYKGAASDYARALDIRPDWIEVRHNYDLVLAKLAGK